MSFCKIANSTSSLLINLVLVTEAPVDCAEALVLETSSLIIYLNT